MNERTKFAIKLIVSVSILGYLVHTIGPGQIAATLGSLSVAYFLVALSLDFLNDVISAKRLQILFRSNAGNIRFITAYLLYYIGKFFNTFLPTNVGGDVFKAYELGNRAGNQADGYSSVFMDRFLGLVSWTLIAAVVALAFHPLFPFEIKAIVLATVGFVIVVSTVLFSDVSRSATWRIFPPVGDVLERMNALAAIERFHTSVNAYRGNKRAVAYGLLLSIVFDLILIVINVVLAWSIGMNVPLHFFFLYVPITAFLLFIPISVKGLGMREVIYVYFFTNVGASPTHAISLALLIHILELIAGAIGGLAYLTYPRFK